MPEKKADLCHHEQTKSVQVAFFTHVNVLSNVIEEMGNPFIDNNCDLLVLNTREPADPAVVDVMCMIEKLGREQYETFVNNECLVDQV